MTQPIEEIQNIVAYVSSARSRMIDFVKRLVEAESPTTVPESQKPVQSILQLELEKIGYTVEHIPGQETGGHLFAYPVNSKNAKLFQLLIGHSDTVWPIGTLQNMPARIDGNTMYGPGIYDMKGGLAQIIFALHTIHDLGLVPEVAPMVFVNSDEETGSEESDPWLRKIIEGADRALVLEPSLGVAGKIKTERKGVGQFQIKVYGKASHAGLDPQAGVSAIAELSYLIQQLFAMNDPVRGVSVNVGTIQGGIRPNVVAPESSATIDVRVPTQQDAKEIDHKIRNLKLSRSEISLEVTGGFSRPPMEQTPRNLKLWELTYEAGKKMGIELQQGKAGGASDGNLTSLFTATIDGLGAVGDGAHANHEHLLIDAMLERTSLLVQLVLLDALEKV